MVADGNGITNVFATRLFEGQMMGKSEEKHLLSYEEFQQGEFLFVNWLMKIKKVNINLIINEN